MLRSICSVVSSSRSAAGNAPVSRPSAKPRPPPMARPMQRALGADPARRAAARRSTARPRPPAPWRWAPAGRAPKPARHRAASSQTSSSADRHEPGRERAGPTVAGRAHASRPRGRAALAASSLAIISPNGPALRTCRRSRPVRGLQRQQREHQLGEAVGTPPDAGSRDRMKRVDAELHVLAHARRPPSRGRRPAPCRPRRAPGRRRPTGWG